MSNIDNSCFTDIKQKFLLSITIHKAKNLRVLNADTFVVVSLEDVHKKTAVYQNHDHPYFNEYFVYELETSLNELLKKSLIIRVIQRKWICRKNLVIGEATLDLAAIWEAPSKFNANFFL